MSAAHDGGSAFPTTMQHDLNGEAMTVPQPGMSLRDHFAGLAMQGILSDPNIDITPERLAELAYLAADAMLEARK